jgi:hypothetical protein
LTAANPASGAFPRRTIGTGVPYLKTGATAPQQKISGAFQLMLGLYIILTSSFPTIVQSISFGIQGDAWSEFAAAMATQTLLSLLLLAPVLVLSNHPLGILHPLILAVVVWPIMTAMAGTVEDFGGWAGVLAGTPVQAPYFRGLLSHSPSVVWGAITKYNALQIVGLLATYLGFSLWRAKQGTRGNDVWVPDPASLRRILIGFVAISMLVLAAFIQSRGGLISHLVSLGHGRFRELAGDGPILVVSDLGFIAVLIWIAARPQDVRSPLFLGCVAMVTASQFISNGSRGTAIETPMMAALVWALRTQRIPWRIAILLGPIMFLSIGSLGVLRTLAWTGQTVNEAMANTGISGSFVAAQAEIASRHADSAPVPVVARGHRVTDGPLLGQTYVAAITAVVPRAVWEGKPRGVGSIYAQLFHGAASDAASTPVSATAEMYWNFGLAGVVLLSMLYGMLLRWAYGVLWRGYPNPIVIVFYALFVTTFDISSKKLVDLQQFLGLLLISYFIIQTFVPRIRLNAAAPAKRPRVATSPPTFLAPQRPLRSQ